MRLWLCLVSQSREERGNILGSRANRVRREGIYSDHGPIARGEKEYTQSACVSDRLNVPQVMPDHLHLANPLFQPKVRDAIVMVEYSVAHIEVLLSTDRLEIVMLPATQQGRGAGGGSGGGGSSRERGKGRKRGCARARIRRRGRARARARRRGCARARTLRR
eukprot:57290-Prorocentrum_minimum.AAC.1